MDIKKSAICCKSTGKKFGSKNCFFFLQTWVEDFLQKSSFGDYLFFQCIFLELFFQIKNKHKILDILTPH
jgi:hypothetical protein